MLVTQFIYGLSPKRLPQSWYLPPYLLWHSSYTLPQRNNCRRVWIMHTCAVGSLLPNSLLPTPSCVLVRKYQITVFLRSWSYGTGSKLSMLANLFLTELYGREWREELLVDSSAWKEMKGWSCHGCLCCKMKSCSQVQRCLKPNVFLPKCITSLSFKMTGT